MRRADFERSFVVDAMSFNEASGYPQGDDLYYECSLCGEIVRSQPIESAECSCGNLLVDSDTGQLLPRHGDGTVKVLRAHPRSHGGRTGNSDRLFR
jgi:hypothetical protein